MSRFGTYHLFVMTYLMGKNGQARDSRISLNDDTHIYTVNGATGYTSVSTLVHHYFTKFDPVKTADTMVRRTDFKRNKRYQQYWGFLEQCGSMESLITTICEFWVKHGTMCASLGTKLHRYIELKYNVLARTNDGVLDECPQNVIDELNTINSVGRGKEYDFADAYIDYKETCGFVPFRTEWMLYDTKLKVSGTIDMIYYHPVTQTYHMVDWKRSKKISKFAYGKFGTGPCAQLPDCNHSHYSLQLNLYTWLLETHYGIVIKSMDIVVFHPSNRTFLEFAIPRLECTTSVLGVAPRTPEFSPAVYAFL